MTKATIEGQPVQENAYLRVELLGQGARHIGLRRLAEIVESDIGWEMLCELMGSDV